MDILEDLLHTILHASNTLLPHFLPYRTFYNRNLAPYTTPLLRTLSSLPTPLSTPQIDLTNLLLLLGLGVLSLKLLGMLRRMLFAWILFFIRLAFWTALVGVGIWVYARGVEDAVADLGGLVAGAGRWGGEMRGVWEVERGRWEGVAREARGRRMPGQGRGREGWR